MSLLVIAIIVFVIWATLNLFGFVFTGLIDAAGGFINLLLIIAIILGIIYLVTRIRERRTRL